MLGHKTQKVDAALRAASTFWVLVCLNINGDSYEISFGLCSALCDSKTDFAI
jgi:hypothetical protein